uniref:Transposable element Tc1 transposase n=1 Tax=Bactrocera latifrons TaxID=174628 RepID=A0A0K8VY42_BACLA
MVWGCISAKGMGNLHLVQSTLDRFQYLDILKENLKQSCVTLEIKDNFIFYQNNDPKPKSAIALTLFIYNHHHVLGRPAQSSGLNVIEQLRQEVSRKVYQRQYYNVAGLETATWEAWNSIPPEFYQKLVASIPGRLKPFLSVKLYATKYK